MINTKARRLSKKEKIQFLNDGYVKNLPVFSSEGVKKIQEVFKNLSNRLPKNIDINKTNMWNKASKSFYEISATSTILDYVEDVIGKNFYLWGGMFFFKEKKSKSIVPWHQDSQYWPLKPSKSVTVWLAVYDTDRENAAMKIIPGSHKVKNYSHNQNNNKNYLLNKEVSGKDIKNKKVVYMDLKAGEISLHSDALLHASDENKSLRPRCGIVLRYSPSDVKVKLSEWPFFSVQHVRGVDNYDHNPVAPIPRGEATPIRPMQFHTEFESQW